MARKQISLMTVQELRALDPGRVKGTKKKLNLETSHSDRMALIVERFKLPQPVEELKFMPPRKWAFDFCWPESMVVLEVEGGAWSGGRHTRGSGFIKDMEKYNAATMLGWRILRCTPQDLQHPGSEKLGDMLRRAVGYKQK